MLDFHIYEFLVPMSWNEGYSVYLEYLVESINAQ